MHYGVREEAAKELRANIVLGEVKEIARLTRRNGILTRQAVWRLGLLRGKTKTKKLGKFSAMSSQMAGNKITRFILRLITPVFVSHFQFIKYFRLELLRVRASRGIVRPPWGPDPRPDQLAPINTQRISTAWLKCELI
ncbi:hypothetical protein RRG08_025754 [Elysia crispata]|uniref:Uncharacterized protein n=1 Tax=Elysia crispata TaxID=231223 RepID=A0AAE1AH11_9GAST|nr:hypothetical protein RRG08_025754 [Elysia crispata]